jgi:predicted AAA+ superfamily ATPase
MGYGAWLHGEAVGCGMVMAARLSQAMGLVDADFVQRLKLLVQKAGLPVVAPVLSESDNAQRYLEWLPATSAGSLAGSLTSDRIEDYYVTPYDLGYDRNVSFDHDFIGRAALERLAPAPVPPTDWLAHPAYVWEGERARAMPVIDALPLEALHGIDAQKAALLGNCTRLASGAAAHDALLWGARGMGKSALVRAAVAAVQADKPGALALVQLAPGTLPSFPALIARLASQPRAFLLFIDDLGFGADGRAEMLALRSLLDGGVAPRPAHIRLAVTANRRAIVEREDTSAALHERDERDDALALAIKLHARKAGLDDRQVCFECQHFCRGLCRNAIRAGLTVRLPLMPVPEFFDHQLQRCPGFALADF